MKRWLVLGLLVVVGAGVTFAVTRVRGNPERRSTVFKLVPVERGSFELVVVATGVIEPIQRVEIRSKASGQVVELPIEEGNKIDEGALIARLDATDARADFDRARAELEIAEVEQRQGANELERQRSLFKQDLISQSQVDAAELEARRASANLILAQTELQRSKDRFDDTVIRSPVSGTVLQKAVEAGQVISSATSSASGGTVIASIADMARVQVTAAVNEIDIGRVHSGMQAEIVADAYPQRSFTGTVVRIAPEAKVVQNVTQFDVLVEVENPDAVLKSGMNCSATIELLSKDAVLLVPTLALQSERGGPRDEAMVTVKTATGFEERTIRLGLRDYDVVEVVDGLQEGDELRVELNSRAFADQQRLQERIRGTRRF
jgi:HlyD family secretion protein